MAHGGHFFWADTLVDLRGFIGSDTGSKSRPAIVMGGYAVVGDGGGGVFYWDESSSTGDNGGTIIVPIESTTGRWVRLYTQVVSVRWFGAKGNGTADDTAAINNTVAACAAAGGGVAYLPTGTYLVSETNFSGAAECVLMATSVTLLGESREGTVIKLNSAQPHFARVIGIKDSSDVVVRNLTIDGNKAAQTDQEEHRAGIFTWDCSRVYLADLNIHDCTGDALDVFAGTQDITVERCYFHDNLRKAVSINGGGQRRMAFRDCVWQKNVGQLHVEAESPTYDLVIERTLIDETTDNNGIALSIGGAGDGARSVGSVVRDCTINGPLYVTYAESVRIQNCRISSDNTVGLRVLCIQFDCLDVVVDGCQIHCPVYNGAGDGVVLIQAAVSIGPNRPRKVRITNNQITSASTIYHIVLIVNALDVAVRGNTIFPTIANYGRAAVAISATDHGFPLPTVDTIIVEDNHMFDVAAGVIVGTTGGLTVQSLTIAGNVLKKGTNVNAIYAWNLDDDGSHALQDAAVFGNEVLGYTAFYCPTYPRPILIGGTRGGGGTYSCIGNPEGQITEIVGAVAYRRDGGAGTTLYVKEAGTGNSGWVAK